jgi:hypothetical protein
VVEKHPICPERIRKIPKQFSWLDQRLVREHYIDRCSHQAAALYLFLAVVADAQGLSYYADRTLIKRLNMDAHSLLQAHQELEHIGLIAYQKPLYQILSLDAYSAPRQSNGQFKSLGQILKQIGQEAT